MSSAIVISLVACALSNAAFAETIKLACHFKSRSKFPVREQVMPSKPLAR